MTTLHSMEKGIVACAKGAPEVILGSCTRLLTEEGEAPLGTAKSAGILEVSRQLASEGLRVLGVSARRDAAR